MLHFHSKKFIWYSQTLRFNRICSENQFFYKKLYEIEAWLKHRGYNERVMRQQTSNARKYKKTELLHNHREEFHKNKLEFNIT